jgi:iron complex outermembrane receptor protein
VQSEELLAFEAGWRWQASARLGIDFTAFYDHYDNLITLEQGSPFTQGGLTFFPFVFDNQGHAIARGAELAADLDVTDRWRLRSAYSIFTLDAGVDPSSTDDLSFLERSAPKNQVNLRSFYDLGEHWELDAAAYYVDQVKSWGNPGYVRTDARLGWNPNENLRFSLGVQNALDARHAEGGEDQIGVGSEVRTNWYFSVSASH